MSPKAYLPAETVEAVKAKLARGFKITRIAKELGVSWQYLYSAVYENAPKAAAQLLPSLTSPASLPATLSPSSDRGSGGMRTPAGRLERSLFLNGWVDNWDAISY